MLEVERGEDLLGMRKEVDIVFLDIKLKGVSGMEVARRWRGAGRGGMIVFITVFPEYVYDAFEVEAVDYLLKPLEEQRFSKVMDRIFRRIYRKNQLFFFSKGSTCQIILLDKVYYFEVINHKIFVHTKEGVLEFVLSMKELEGQLDYRFFRCHRSYFVNLEFVIGCQGGLLSVFIVRSILIKKLWKAFGKEKDLHS